MMQNKKKVYKDILAIRDRKAIKNHNCTICKSQIDKGEYYTIINGYKLGRGYFIIKACLMHSENELLIKLKKYYGHKCRIKK